jgi:hypothetical protein
VRAYDAAGHASETGPHTLIVAIDIELPSVTIASPAEGASLSNQLVVVRGTASDNVAVERVEYQLNDGAFILAEGTENWQVRLALAPGTHRIRVRSTDSAGHVSLSVVRTLHYYDTGSLQVRMTGAGTVTPNLNGAPLELNKRYQLTATPAIGYAFSNWSGGVVGSARQLEFMMEPNLMVQANFVPAPFKPVAGTYNGLFYESNGVTHARSGCFSLSTTARGTFSGRLLLAGQAVRLTGRFDSESKAVVSVRRRGATPLIIRLHLFTLDGLDYVQGQVTDGTWTADLIGDRVRLYRRGETSPFMGRYTLALPGDAQTGIGGDGSGAVLVDRLGGVRLLATLGDGTRLSQRAYVSADGQWPLYGALYRAQGSLCGWLTFTNTAQDDLVGEVSWSKPSNARDRVYPAGFTNQTVVIGSAFRSVRGEPILDLPEGVIRFQDGGLTEAFANLIGIDYRNRVVNLSENQLAMRLLGSGLISGHVTVPGSTTRLTFGGVAHQKRNKAFGHFLGQGVTGSVRVESRE